MVKKLRSYRQENELITEYTKDGKTVSHRIIEDYISEEEREKLEQLTIEQEKAREKEEKEKEEQKRKENEMIKAIPDLADTLDMLLQMTMGGM